MADSSAMKTLSDTAKQAETHDPEAGAKEPEQVGESDAKQQQLQQEESVIEPSHTKELGQNSNPEARLEKPEKPDAPEKEVDVDEEIANLDEGWESNGSVFDEEKEISGLSRFSCNVAKGTLNEQPFKTFWASKQRCADLLQLGETMFTEFLVENIIIQATVQEYFDHVPRTKASDAVRGDSFQHLFEIVKNNQHLRYTSAHEITRTSYNTEDWTTRFYSQVFYELRNTNQGFLFNVSASDEALWAITYCVAKLIINYNRDEKKKAGAKKSIAAQKAKGKSGRKRVKAKYGGFQLLGTGTNTKTADPKDKAKKADKKENTKGVGKKAPRQPPKGVDSIPNVRSGENATIQEDRIPTDYTTLGADQMMDSFVQDQDKWEENLYKKYSDRIQRHARDVEKCMEDLRQNDEQYKVYRNLSRILRSATQRLFDDFRHVDVKKQKLEALKAMGTPDDIHENIPDARQRDNEPDEATINEALATEDAVLHEERQVQARARARADGKVVHLDLPAVSDKHREITKKWVSMLNSPDFQPDYIKDACIQVDIVDFRFKVLPRQNPALHMRWWQVIDVKWNHDHASGMIEGVIGGLTADVVGSGKTIEMGGTILHDMNIVDGIVDDVHESLRGSFDVDNIPPRVDPIQDEAMEDVQTPKDATEKNPERDAGEDVDTDMPDAPPVPLYVRPPPDESTYQHYLVITNPGLVNQTAAEFAGFSSTFRVVALGGTKRRVKDGKRVRSNLGGKEYYRANNLEDSNFFNPHDKETSHTIAVASYLWFSRKYGPKAYHKWLKKTGRSKTMPVPPNWDKTPVSQWERNLKGYVRAALFDEAADGLRNQSTFWFAAHYIGASRIWLFTGSPAPRGIKDYASYLALIQAPGFNELAQRSNYSIDYIAGKTDPYELADDHPAAKFRAAHYCFEKFVVNADLEEYARGIKAQKCLRLWVIRRDHQSACPRGSKNTMARSLPPKDHFILEKLLDPTGLRYYTRFSEPWTERLMLMRKNPDRPDEEGTPTPNGRSIRALEMLSFFWPLGFLHKDLPVPKEVRDNLKKGIVPNDRSILNRDRESFFWDQSPIYQQMPKLSRDEPGKRLRWLFKTIQAHERKKGSKDQVFTKYDFDKMTAKQLASLFLTFSPKMAAVVSLIQHHAVLRDEKMILWFQYPFNQELAQDVLHCLKISPMAMYKESSAFSRDEIQRKFNDPKDRTRILLCGIRVGGTGLNFQYDSHVAAAVDAFSSTDQEVQTGGRQHRNGQVVRCVFYQIIVGRTHDMKILQENIQKSIASAVALMGNIKEFHDPEDIDEDIEHEYANAWETGYFASALKSETTSKAFHLATYSGQQRIKDVREEEGEDWKPTMLDADEAIALLSIQNKTQFVKWHGPSNGTMALADLVDQELQRRKARRIESGEVSEEEEPRTKKTRTSKKKARNEGSTLIDTAALGSDDGDDDEDDDRGINLDIDLSDGPADPADPADGDQDVEENSDDEDENEDAEGAGLSVDGFASETPRKPSTIPEPGADADDEQDEDEDGLPVRHKRKRISDTQASNSKKDGESESDHTAKAPRKKGKLSRNINPVTPTNDVKLIMEMPTEQRQNHLRDTDENYPEFPDLDAYSAFSTKEKRESTRKHNDYMKKWGLPEYKAPKKQR